MYSIEDCYGNEVASGVRPCDSTKVTLYVPDAQLWSMDEPNLYTVTARLQKNNETFDEIYANVGVRSYTVTPNDGFSINGVPTPLRGVARHQDRLYKGNALTAEDHYEDAMLIKELGANTIRLAHYQHSQDFYNACDELGFAVWAEIPFISVFKKDPSAHQNCRSPDDRADHPELQPPLHHVLGLSNEILIGGICQELVDNHHDLQKLVRELDPTRLTTIAHVSNTPVDGPMHHITDVESYNHYFGWYGGKMEQNGPCWTSSTPSTPTSASASPSTAPRVSSTGTATIPSARTTPRSIRHCTTSIWLRCSRIVPGCGLPTAGTCSTLAVLPPRGRRCRPQQQGPDDH